MVKSINKIAILGYGREGKAILKFLKKNPIYKKAKISILDQKLSDDYLKNLERFDLIFRSPGVPYNLPEIKNAIKNGVEFSSATRLFFEKFKGLIIGITGTKGKGTTSFSLYKILKNCGKKVYLAGNIGKPAISLLNQITKSTIVILELSSFQLQDLPYSPNIAVITDIFPDHLNIHKNMKEYLEAKTNIVKHQKRSGVVFYFKNNRLGKKITGKSPAKKIAVSAPDNLTKNFIMAKKIAKFLKCPKNKIEKTIKNFKGLKHRMELIHTIPHNSGLINFYNDSASTNPQTAVAAILNFSKNHTPIILIAGGKDKNLNYSSLNNTIKKSTTKLIILLGENKNKIAQQIKKSAIPIKIVTSLKTATRYAYQNAKRYTLNSKSCIILFSPGAASFDMFKNYEDRGKNFARIVKKLK